jgi:hypothetical protein
MKIVGQGLFVSLLLCGLAFAYSTGEQKVLVHNVVRFGADPTGLSDSAKSVADAIGAGNRKIKFPCGTYLILSPIRVPDNTELEGSGPCTVIKSTPALAFNTDWPEVYGVAANLVKNFIANSDFKNGNSRIHIHGFTLDAAGAGQLGKSLHLISFVKSHDFEVDHINFVGDGTDSAVHDGLNAVEGNYRFRFHHNFAKGIKGAVADVWAGAHDFSIDHNRCEGMDFLSYCVVINSTSSGSGSAYQTRETYNFIVDRNTSTHTHDGGIGVWGLSGSSFGGPWVTGDQHDGVISNNVVDSVVAYHGMVVAEQYRVLIKNNYIRNTGAACIYAGGNPNAPNLGSFHDNIIANNICENVGQRSSVPAIQIGTPADRPLNIVLACNVIRGKTHHSALYIAPGSERIKLIMGERMNPGSSGSIIHDQSGRLENSIFDPGIGRLCPT